MHPKVIIRSFRIEDIQQVVSKKFKISRLELLSFRRDHAVVRPRQVAMYLCKMLTTKSLPEIGRRFGGMHHTTVIHAVRTVEQRRQEDEVLNADIVALISMVTEAEYRFV